MENYQDTASFAIVSLMSFGVALLPIATWVSCEISLEFYRRAVQRSMREKATSQAAPIADPPPPAAPDVEPAPGAAPRIVDLQIQTADQAPAVSADGNALHAGVRRAIRDGVKIYAAAGLAYTAVLVLAFGLRFQAFSFLPLLFLCTAFAWPFVLTAVLIAAPSRRRQIGIVVAYWTLFMTSAAFATVPADAEIPLFMANIGGTMTALVIRARRIRAVAPLVVAFLTLMGVTLITVASLGLGDTPAEGEFTGLDVLAFLVTMLLLVVGPPVAGWLSLRWLGRWYAAKRTSDQTLTMAAIWLIFAGVHGSTIAYDDLRWMAAGFLGFAVFLGVTAAGFRVLRQRSMGAPAPRLLVLRVFALGRRSRRLFDRLAARWRQIGSVQLIAGPDLAPSTVEPHEFYDFLRRRLSGRFLESQESIEHALAGLDTAPDHDGRYRVTDFFCRDNAWRTVFRHLARGANVVLMDLRGFTKENSGCTYEVGELLNLVPLDRIAIVIDGGTDDDFLARTIEQASVRIAESSPNRGAPTIRVRVFRDTGGRGPDPDTLLRLLCETAAHPHAAAVAQMS